MAMNTHLEVINAVLRHLRESAAVASSDSAYTQLISEFVAEAYREVLGQHQWRTLRRVGEYTITANTYNFNLTDGTITTPDPVFGRTAATPNAESEVLRHNGRTAVWVSTDSGTSFNRISEITMEQYAEERNKDPDQTATAPEYVAFEPLADGDLMAHFYPAPSANILFRLMFYRNPTELEIDDTTDATTLEIPSRPVRDLALVYALNERGEEMGEPGNMAEKRYGRSLADAIERDISAYGHTNQYDWERD